ncbi:hypothetical protein [Glaesserella sp. 15-184]|uniref:Lipoprotein SmpA/OmlA domain-containing protein n=2 Tax=Glaesserella australis TaxID=2094024 RepID=A0A328BW84_9PAST|nr:hypothetical protein [Glaesserella sp. 15-184]AUI65931.1 hypothetical protein CJD39_04790 [Glaesserella sp. 15-184]RAL18349.1 hypothetical protein C5N92_09010 [Glaesserella australis]
MKKTLLCLTLVLTMTACTVNHEGSTKLREQTLTSIESKIIANKTTKNQVRELMGEPTKITLEGNLNELWFYESYDKHMNYTPTVMLPITLPLAIVFGSGKLVEPIKEKKNVKHLRVRIDTSTNMVTNVSTAVTEKDWY